jgi:hypothetical protein
MPFPQEIPPQFHPRTLKSLVSATKYSAKAANLSQKKTIFHLLALHFEHTNMVVRLGKSYSPIFSSL